MNDHHHVQKNLPLYVSGDLDEATLTRIASHLEQCEECRAACQQQRTLLSMLSAESVGDPRRPMPVIWRRFVTAAAAAIVFSAGYITARQAGAIPQTPKHPSSQPSRVYDRYVASHAIGSGMFRALAAVARAEEPR